MQNKKKISIVSPCFNEELNIEDCISSIKNLFNNNLKDYDYEHIICDNCSIDNTKSILEGMAKNDNRLKIIFNNRNYGILNNTYNGVMNASGDAILLFFPVDLQDPPELIPEFIKKWEEGYKVVYGRRVERDEPFILRSIRNFYYLLLSTFSNVKIPPYVGDFQLVDKIVVEDLKKINNPDPFLRIMTFDTGHSTFGIDYKWKKRLNGKSKNNFISMIFQGLNGVVNYSTFPLRFCLIFGFIISFLSIIYAFYIFLDFIYFDASSDDGIPTLLCGLFFFSGTILFFLGLIGEYLQIIFKQLQNKPHVIASKKINF